MIYFRMPGLIGIVICLLAACSPIPPQTTPVATLVPVSAPTVIREPLPLSAPGPYLVGLRRITVTDPTRSNREVTITVWYPAVRPTDSPDSEYFRDADPDLSEAPYPLILSSGDVAGIFAKYLVSHGFTWASVDKIHTYPKMNEQMLDQPLDILFALDQVSADPPDSLAGMIDADHSGVIGYSFDGYNTLALSGARIDPAYYLAQCPTPDALTGSILSDLSAFDCGPADAWDAFVAHAGEAITGSEDGLWQPLTDARIRAVMPMAGEGWWLFGEKGLATADRPALFLGGSSDELYPENNLIFEHYGAPAKTRITFIGQTHMMIFTPEMAARIAHFAVAFFGYHLQGREAYADYFSVDFVSRYADLAWGLSEK
jgi:predicted dienelactone hydrolase